LNFLSMNVRWVPFGSHHTGPNSIPRTGGIS
jgi:hypothetical protein